MSLAHNPYVVTDNSLMLYLDVMNSKCYPGSPINDISGNSRNFTFYGSPTVSNGQIHFSGSQYIWRSESLDWSAIDFSLCSWIIPKNNTDTMKCKVFDLMDVGNGHLTVAAYTTPYFTFRPTAGSDNTLAVGGSLSNGAWANLVVTKNNTTYKLYINGELQSTNINASLVYDSNMTRIQVGYSHDDDLESNTFSGSMGPISIYTRELSQSEITQNFQAHRSRFGI